MKYDAAINLALDAHELLVRKAAAFDALTTRVPMTEEQLDVIIRAWRDDPHATVRTVARAVEAFHDIGGLA